MPKFFVDKNNIGEKNIEITGDDAKHISTVLRAKVDEEIIICDGYGTDYLCRLIGINKKQVLAEIIEKYENKNEPELKITLYQGLPKGDKMELVIQKCIEIGVDRIIPVITDNTVVKIGDKAEKKNLRWNKIAEAAAMSIALACFAPKRSEIIESIPLPQPRSNTSLFLVTYFSRFIIQSCVELCIPVPKTCPGFIVNIILFSVFSTVSHSGFTRSLFPTVKGL